MEEKLTNNIYDYDKVVHVVVELIKWCEMFGHTDESDTPFYNTYYSYMLSSHKEGLTKIDTEMSELIARSMDVYYHVYLKGKADVYIQSDKKAYSHGILLKRYILAEHIYNKWTDYIEEDYIKEIYEIFPNWSNNYSFDNILFLVDQLPIIINSIKLFECSEFDNMFVSDVKKDAKILKAVQEGINTLYSDLQNTVNISANYSERTFVIIGYKDEYLNDIFKSIVSYNKEQIKSKIKPENLIKDNRIISDKTFATRFKSFLQNIIVNDAASDEELEYLKMIADKLLQFQIYSATEDDEVNYLNMIYSKEK